MEKTVGENGSPVSAYQNYAEIRYEYEGGKVVKESYFDEQGMPSIQPAGHVAKEPFDIIFQSPAGSIADYCFRCKTRSYCICFLIFDC